MFDLFTVLQTKCTELEDKTGNSFLPSEERAPSSEVPRTQSMQMRRVIFWSHHLVAPSKRRQFAAWCAELRVWGFVKLGYPGFMCFEGEDSDVADMVSRTKSMQWHALSLRTEVGWRFDAEDNTSDVHMQALAHCSISYGRVKSDAVVRPSCDEVESVGDFVSRCVEPTKSADESGCDIMGLRRRRSMKRVTCALRGDCFKRKKLASRPPSEPHGPKP